jgi:hypothetical protein
MYSKLSINELLPFPFEPVRRINSPLSLFNFSVCSLFPNDLNPLMPISCIIIIYYTGKDCYCLGSLVCGYIRKFENFMEYNIVGLDPSLISTAMVVNGKLFNYCREKDAMNKSGLSKWFKYCEDKINLKFINSI